MKTNTKRVPEEKPREPMPPPSPNSDIRPDGWWHIGEAAQLAVSRIEHDTKMARAELGAATLTAHDKLEEAHDQLGKAHAALGEYLNVIRLWRNPPDEGQR
jgi:hypothetical protein